MIDSAKCLHCGDTFIARNGVMYEHDPKPGKVRLEEHKCQTGLKTQVFEVSDYKAAMLLIDLPALDKRLSIDMNYQPKSVNRYVGACNLNQRLYEAVSRATDFLTLTPEMQVDSLPTLIRHLEYKGYIVTDLGPIPNA